MLGESAAFMSYVRFNDEHDDGQLTAFRERLSTEVRAQTGEEFLIFQDRNDIAWGQNWQQRINETLDAVTLLLVIITPGLFRSAACRDEVSRFAERERRLGRQDLILPVYYISAREMDDPDLRESDELAKLLASRQQADWRELRFEPFTSPVVRKAIAHLAVRMRDVFGQPSLVTPVRSPRLDALLSAPAADMQPGMPDHVIARNEPPTHVVDAYQRGDFATVSEAIKAAKPGDRILVRPGLYEEGLVIDKPLEILGDGPVPEIEIRTHDAATVAFMTTIGRIANLTLRQTGGQKNWFCVEIAQGRLDLEGCDISNQAWVCVGIRNGADPRLRRNQIHGGSTSGVIFYDNGLGTLEDNDITDNSDYGVIIVRGSNPTLRRNRIHENKRHGVFMYDNGLGILEDNDISENGGTGTAITDGSNPTLRRNRISKNKSAGVHVAQNSSGTLEDNDITGNFRSGISILRGGNPTLRRNRINNNEVIGVLISDNGLGILEENEIIDNGLVGVAITTGSNPTLLRNEIHRNTEYAVVISNGARARLQANDLTDNAGGAWRIAEDCEKNVVRIDNKE